MTSLLIGLLAPAALLAAPQDAARTDEVLEAVEQVVDLPTPKARRRAAAALAKELDLDALELAEVLAGFGRFEAATPGVRVETAELRVLDEVERTQLHVLVPASYDPAVPAPLLLSFHGSGGDGAHALSMWRGVAEEVGALVVAPTDTGANQGYAFSAREREAALAALRWARRRWNVDEDRVFATGVSRGGHLVWDLALRFPDRFAGVAPMIGGPRISLARGQNNLRYVENVVGLSIRDLQGAQDDPGLVFNLRLLFERLRALGATDAELLLQEGHGHSFDPSVVDWAAWLESARRDPDPDRAIRRSAREGEGRAFRIEVLGTKKDVKEEFPLKVPASVWNALDDDGKRRHLAESTEALTARLEVERSAPGRFRIAASGVASFRLLLTSADLAAGAPIEVQLPKKRVKKRLRPSRRVLLVEFAERFDRRFLPVAELELRP